MIEFNRFFNYIFGLFVITLGVGLSIKSGWGVTPVSSIPYTLNVIWGIEIGIATVIFHTLLVVIELILLRRAFKIKHFLQVPVGILFGVFTSFSVNVIDWLLPDSSNIFIIIIMVVFSAFLVALGLFFYVPTNIVPLSVEGITQAIAIVSNQPFTKVKVCFDISVVALSLVLCLIFIASWGSVGIGTIFSAVFVGIILKYINKVVLHFTGLSADLKKM